MALERKTALYREVEAFFAACYLPGANHIADATDLSVTPDGRRASFTGTV